MTIILTKSEIEKIKQNKITAELKAKIIESADEAQACNYGTNGDIVYIDSVPVIEEETNDVYEIKICWETTEEWKRSCRANEIRQILDNEREGFRNEIKDMETELEKLFELGICDATDESNACDWEDPCEISIQ